LRTDVYQLGCLLYEMLVGSPPFSPADAAELIKSIVGVSPTPPSVANRNVPGELDGVVLKALAKRKDERFKNVDRMITALEGLKLKGDVLP
jgi:serine/threonine protein kinase